MTLDNDRIWFFLGMISMVGLILIFIDEVLLTIFCLSIIILTWTFFIIWLGDRYHEKYSKKI
jgi:hypothetical protein